MVAVGSEIHYNKNWHTFVDFLFDYIGRFFSREWYLDEKARGADAHPFVGWIDGALHFRMGGDPEPDGTRSAVPSGPAMAFLLVAYDLYVLHDFRLIHDDLAARLLHKDQFQGARYELAVAAVMVRADCEIVMEDETDKSKKHHEFDCERRITSERISVEAKSKHRHGVMGYTRGKRVDIDKQKAGFRRLLTAATEKPTEHARIIFVELNLPARETSDQIRSWEAEIEKIISSVLKTHGGECPWSMLVLTNRPHHYGSEDEPTPTCSALIHVPTDPVVKLSEDTIRAIQTAVNQSDRIPNWFSEDDEYQE